MKVRSVDPLIGLAISFALPIYAQQRDLADPQTTQKILALAKAFDEAHSDNDAAVVAALYTRDAVLDTSEGPIIGRQAIHKYYTDLYQWWHPKNCITKTRTASRVNSAATAAASLSLYASSNALPSARIFWVVCGSARSFSWA